MGVITERERQKYFAYLDGVADGLNESSRDIIDVLDKIRDEIRKQNIADFIAVQTVLEIIDKYRRESE